ncbi:proline-rich acidic protein 1 isoform X3 [Hyperolius riggenbachi]
MVMMPAKTKALKENEEWERDKKRDIELGLLAIEPPVKNDDVAVAFDSHIIQKVEEDRDNLHHSRQSRQRDFPKQRLGRVQARQILTEPEEDRDHLYHPR